jgi:acetoin utilization deacetylase AcuC-like enzyme
MLTFHHPDSALHAPPLFFRRGKLIPAPESPERYSLMLETVRGAGHEVREAPDHGLAPIAAIHDAAYLEFLQSAWSRRAELDSNADELLTTQFARVQMHQRSGGLINQLGYHTADTSTRDPRRYLARDLRVGAERDCGGRRCS